MTVRWLDPLFVNAGGAAIQAGVDEDARWFVRGRGDSLPADRDWRLLLPLMQPGYGGR